MFGAQYLQEQTIGLWRGPQFGINALERQSHKPRSIGVNFQSVLISHIKQADQIAAYLEATQLAGFGEDEAMNLFGKPPVMNPDYDLLVKPWTAEEAKTRFIERFIRLETR